MLERISERFAGILLHEGIISEDDADVYRYGFFQLVMLLLNVVTTIILAFLFHAMVPCIMLNLSYIPLRVSAGGHHANTPIRCYVNSTIMIAALLAVMKWVTIHPYVATGVLAFASCIVLALAPVETADDPFDSEERKVYRRRSIVVLLVEIFAYIVLMAFFEGWMADAIVLGVFTESLMLVIGKLV